VLVSQATQTIIADEEEEPGFMLSDLGERTLKDLDRPVRLFQLAAPGLDNRAPPTGQRTSMLAGPSAAEPGAFAAAATRGLPRDTAAFTGRQDELAQLLGLIDATTGSGGVVGIHAIDGMAGIGKTTLAVHAAHRLAERFPDGQFFLPLHAHTAGQRPVDPADALVSLLLTVGLAPQLIPPGLEARSARWRDQVAGKMILLLLDDAAGHEQVQPLLPGTAGSLVLVTSRRRLAALPDATVISLDALPPDQAAALLARMAGRAGMNAGDAAVAEVTRLCGYLPLAIGMLASQLRHHPAWTPAGMAASLNEARDRLALMHAENLSVAAAFDLSYQDLTADQQRLFRRLGLVPGPSIDAHAAAALDGTSLDTARRLLEELYDQHLLTEPAPGRYQLHDLIREHARTLATSEGDTEAEATGRLLDYYLHTALAASQHLTPWNLDVDSFPPARPPACAPQLSTLGQAATWVEAERVNLQAAVSYAASSGRPGHAILIPAAIAGFLDLQGHWDQALALHRSALATASRVGDRPGQARALMLLSGLQFMTSDPAVAKDALQQALALYRDLGDRVGQANAINSLGFVHRVTGDYPAAIASHQQALEMFRDVGHRRGQGYAHNELGIAQWETGDYPAAAASSQQALALFRDLGDRYGESDALINLGTIGRLTGDYTAAADMFEQARELNRDLGDRYRQAWILNELGLLLRLIGDYSAAAASHQQALEDFRDFGDLGTQAHALNALGLVQQQMGDHRAASASHQQALQLARDANQRPDQADVLNSLGELASRTSATHQAREYHGQALAIAREIGIPPEEARALEGVGRSHLQDGNPSQADSYLRSALAIYQRIGGPGARRVQDTLRDLRSPESTE
jgi:tetratricopeptide (TPR) repeat protein